MIRLATPADDEAILRIYLQSAHHHAAIDPERYRIPTIVNRSKDQTLVAELNSEVVGFADLRLDRSPDPMHRDLLYCHIVEIAVDENHRSQGIGAALMQAAEAWGRSRGAQLISLEYNAANPRAGEFYERQGYQIASITAIKRI
jgi:ribosomal protein S18 acetylase RimI-like enzyme